MCNTVLVHRHRFKKRSTPSSGILQKKIDVFTYIIGNKTCFGFNIKKTRTRSRIMLLRTNHSVVTMGSVADLMKSSKRSACL